jgi:hypothetical protein
MNNPPVPVLKKTKAPPGIMALLPINKDDKYFFFHKKDFFLFFLGVFGRHVLHRNLTSEEKIIGLCGDIVA